MNNVFNPKRFACYFLYDLKNGFNNYGISLLVLGFMPLLTYLICSTFRLIFDGSFNCDLGSTQKILTSACYVGLMIAYPTKVYGRFTEKRAGANWITLPVSSFEKFLSMVLILVVVLPLVFTLLMMLSNGILALIYGDSSKNLFSMLLSASYADNIDGSIHVSKNAFIFFNWANSVLLFALGAIIFKKAKVAKTFLFTFLAVMLLISIIYLIFNRLGIVIEYDFNLGVREINLLLNLVMIGEFLVLCGGLYWRITTIKV